MMMLIMIMMMILMMMILKKTDGVSRGAKFHGTRLRSVSILAQRLGTSGARDAFSAGPAGSYHVVLALRTKPAMEGAVPGYGFRSQQGGLGPGQSHQRSYLRRAVGHAIGRRYESHGDWCSRAKPGGYTAAQCVHRGFQAGESNAVTCASALVPRQVRPSVKSNLRSLLPGMPGAAHQLLRTIQCRAGTPSRQPSAQGTFKLRNAILSLLYLVWLITVGTLAADFCKNQSGGI